MEEQVRKFKPDMVCMMSEAAAKELKSKISDTNTKVVCGMDGLIECATYDKADTVLNSVVGMFGLQPTLEAIRVLKCILSSYIFKFVKSFAEKRTSRRCKNNFFNCFFIRHTLH